MKRSKKIIFILAFIIIILSAVSMKAFARYTPGSITINTSTNLANTTKDITGSIVGVIRVVGTIVSVATISALGVRYMMGSVEEKAEYKKTLFPYFIGAILVFAAANLAQIIYNWSKISI